MTDTVFRAGAAVTAALVLSGIAVLSGCGREERRIPPSSRGASTAGGPAPASPVSLMPEKPDVRTGIRAVLTGLPRGASASVKKVRWFINGTEYSTYEEEQLPGNMIRKGDVVRARAEIETGGKTLAVESSEAAVRNSPPDVVAADLSDLAPKTGMEIRAIPTGRDADGDPVTFLYRWFLDGKEVPGETANFLSLAGVAKGTWVHAEIQATDGSDSGPIFYTPKIRVVNTPPKVAQVAIIKGTGGRYAANVRARDADGDPVTIVAKSLPPGVDLTENTLSWEEGAVRPGMDKPVVLLLSDGDGGEVEYSFFLSSGKN